MSCLGCRLALALCLRLLCLHLHVDDNQRLGAVAEDARTAWLTALPGGADANFWDSLLNLASEVMKLKLVDIYQKHREALCVLEQASSAERAQMRADKKAAAAALVDGGAERRGMAIDPMALEAEELSNVVVIVLKRLLKIELKEMLLQDLQPIFHRLIACIIVLIGIGLACCSYFWYGNPDNLSGSSFSVAGATIDQSELGTLRHYVEKLQEDSAVGTQAGAAAELSAVVERLAALVERMEAAAAKSV